MPFLAPKQQCQNADGRTSGIIFHTVIIIDFLLNADSWCD